MDVGRREGAVPLLVWPDRPDGNTNEVVQVIRSSENRVRFMATFPPPQKELSLARSCAQKGFGVNSREGRTGRRTVRFDRVLALSPFDRGSSCAPLQFYVT